MARQQLTSSIRLLVNNNPGALYNNGVILDPNNPILAFKTLQDAWNYLLTLDLNGWFVTIQLIDSVTPYDGVNMGTPLLGSGGLVTIQGNLADPTKVTVQPNAANQVFTTVGQQLSIIPLLIQSLTMTDAGKAGINIGRAIGGIMNFQNVILNLSGTGGSPFVATQFAQIGFAGSFVVNFTGSPTINNFFFPRLFSGITFNPTSPTFTGTVTIPVAGTNAFIGISGMGFVNWVPTSIAGAAGVTGAQINIGGGFLDTQGNALTPIPGQATNNVGGTTTGQGWVR